MASSTCTAIFFANYTNATTVWSVQYEHSERASSKQTFRLQKAEHKNRDHCVHSEQSTAKKTKEKKRKKQNTNTKANLGEFFRCRFEGQVEHPLGCKFT